MRNKRYVLDANVWVSYFISNQYPVLENFILAKGISLIYCTELLSEISRVLSYPHLAKRGVNIKEAINYIRIIGVEFTLSYPIKNYIPADPDDNYVIALALQSTAGFVTSGDKDILSEKENLEKRFKKLRIITKTEFEQSLS